MVCACIHLANHIELLLCARHCFRHQENTIQCPHGAYSVGSGRVRYFSQQSDTVLSIRIEDMREGACFLWGNKTWDLVGYFSGLSCPFYIFLSFFTFLFFFLSCPLSLSFIYICLVINILYIPMTGHQPTL